MARFIAHPTSVVQAASVGKLTRIGAYSVLATGAEVGAQSEIGAFCTIESGAHVGSLVCIGDRVTVPAGVAIGDWAVLEAGVAFSDGRSLEPGRPRPTRIGEGARIAANATIRCGVTVGRAAEVGPGALVDEDVPDHARVAAAQGRPAGWRCTCGQALDLPPTGDGRAQCRCGRAYLLEDGRVTGYGSGR